MNRTELLTIVQGACTACGGYRQSLDDDKPHSIICVHGDLPCPIKDAAEVALGKLDKRLGEFDRDTLLKGRTEALATLVSPSTAEVAESPKPKPGTNSAKDKN